MTKYQGYIYSIQNLINGKQYIGKTNNIERRWREHRNHKGGTAVLEKAFLKYGIENFKFEIIDYIEAFDIIDFNNKLSALEIYYICKLDTFNNGYNATTGGDGTSNRIMSQETKDKISKALTGRTLSEKHKEFCRTAFKGKHHTKEARDKIRKALLSRDPLIYEKVREKLKGRVRDREMIMKAAYKRRKIIQQYSLQGEFVAEYVGAVQVPFKDISNIITCCKHRINSAYGFIWRYKEDTTPLIVPTKYHISNLPIIQKDINDNFIASFDSITQAANILHLSRTGINNALKGRSNSCGGYKWIYKKENII